MKSLEEHLMAQLEIFTGFVRKRINDPELAADLVQEGLLKAIKAANPPRDEDTTNAWFYRILRRTIIDLYRRRAASTRALESFRIEMERSTESEGERIVCECISALIPSMRPEYGRLLQRLDLEQEVPETVAKDLGVTANNLRVRHHRARQQLRERLETMCQLCAVHGCVDCTCGPR